MNNETRDFLKIGLLGVIAVCLVYGTFFKRSSSKRSVRSANTASASEGLRSAGSGVTDNKAGDGLSVSLDPNKDQGSSSTFSKTTVAWNNESYDFGTVKQHTENEYVFTFTNTGSEPYLIDNAQGSCGCTVPEYPKEPILPGGTGEIRVKYSPGSQIGQQTKTVAISSNDERGSMNLYIHAMVEEAPDPLLVE